MSRRDMRRLRPLTQRKAARIGRFSWFSMAGERNPLKTSRDGAGPDIISRAKPESPNHRSNR